jgi:hypothetical protein
LVKGTSKIYTLSSEKGKKEIIRIKCGGDVIGSIFNADLGVEVVVALKKLS